jgi:hypothetical protein
MTIMRELEGMMSEIEKVTAHGTTTPRREDIPGITPELPDLSDWKEAAKVLKIRPFFEGPDSKPFSCLRATQMRMDPPMIVDKKRFFSVNDFLLAEECR